MLNEVILLFMCGKYFLIDFFLIFFGMKSFNIIEGEDIEFECCSDGYFLLIVIWKRIGGFIVDIMFKFG